ncbi:MULTISPECIES: spore germination protein [Paenibacillus]|uniref:Spore germination protein KA n=1 Tax=Paenibacillus albilobatus TaxID=2716884 RepID=A0A919XEF2_9BACL|nr:MULTISPECIES: spore germination protein [Paenibacillus]GIO29490.1 spore germination protein KA [Paenibacillus albilobatus]
MTKSESKSEKTVWTMSKIQNLFAKSFDVVIRSYRLDKESASSEVVLVYASGLADSAQISQVVLPELQDMHRESGFFLQQNGEMYSKLAMDEMKEPVSEQDIEDTLFQGGLIILIPLTNKMYTLDICNAPKRAPEESNVEISIKGPKDGFTEDFITNIALIRKRIRSNTLCCEELILGRRSRTRVALMYIDDIISPNILEEARKRLKKIDIDAIYSINQLEEFLADSKFSLFPLMDFSGRPDYVIASLINGRFVVVIDGVPMALIGPATLSLQMKSPEDVQFNYIYVSFVRFIRLLSLIITIGLPAFWVSLTAFHQDQIPFRLMATIATSRMGLPLSAQMELFEMLILLEIFREAGIRLPSAIGQTLTVIGGLIIGDAAIRAGLVSPSSVVVGAITAVASATLVNQTLSSVVSFIRFLLFFVSCILGMYGMILGGILLIAYVSRLRSFGVPYLSPVSPVIPKDVLLSLLRSPWKALRKKPSSLSTVDSDHHGESPA